MEFLGHGVCTFSILLEYRLCSKVDVAAIGTSISCIKSIFFPHPHKCVMLLDFNFHCGCDVLSHCSLNLHFVISNKVEHLFACLFPFMIINL